MFNQISSAGRLRDALLRHRWIFLLSLFLVSSITTGAVLLRPKTYHASASTQVVTDTQQVAEALGEKYRYLYVSSAQQHVNHFNDLTNDDLPGGFWDTVLQDANLAAPINIDPRAKDPRFVRLRKNVTAVADSDTLFTIGLSWTDAAECERILEALQKQYSFEIGQEQQIKSLGTTNFLQKEIGGYEDRLQKAEKAVSDYKSEHGGLLESAQKAEYDNLAALKAKRDGLLAVTQNGSNKAQMLETQLAQTPPKTIFEQTLTDSPAIKTLGFLQDKRFALLAEGNAPTGSRLRDVEQQIASIKKIIAAEQAKQAANPNASPFSGTSVSQTRLQDNPNYNVLRRQVLSARIDQKSALEQLKSVSKSIAEYEKRFAAIPAQEAKLAALTRDYDLVKGQYNEYKNRLEAARTKAQLDKVTAADTLIRVGTIYASPTQGQAKTLLMFAGGLILGFVVAIGVVVFAEWNDSTLRYPADVERFLNLPVLASVPELAAIDTSRDVRNSAPDALPGGDINDSYRYVRNAGLAARNPSMGTFGP